MADTGATTVTNSSGDQFQLKYVDDFSAGMLNTSLWGYPYGGGIYWNGAFSWGWNDVNVVNGQMVVSSTWHPEGYWTAGGINMLGAGDGHGITYGRVEFDAKVDKGQGTGTAILLWPTSNDHWPPEIDLIETPHGSRDQITFTTHWQGPGGNNDNRYQGYDITVDASLWHHYVLDWTPEKLDFYIDGQLVVHMADHIPSESMSFGVMGYVAASYESWYGGGPDATTPKQVNTYLDNVKIYQWLGTVTPSPAPAPPPVPVSLEAGSGADVLVLKISQDAWQGAAQYTVSVDGVQVGGIFTASASHAAGQSDTLTLHGDWGAGSHTVTVTFLNDAWDGATGADRNLYLDGVSYNGAELGAAQAIYSEWQPGRFSFTGPGTPAHDVPPVRFGSPSAGWDQADKVRLGHLDHAGTDYLTFSGIPAWGTLSAKLAAGGWQPGDATHLAFENFVSTDLDLASAGDTGIDLLISGASSGDVTLGAGDDRFTWVAHSAGGQDSDRMVIRTGDGNDTVRLTAAGLTALDDAGVYGQLYNPAYDGRLSTAEVLLGAGQDSIATEGLVKLVAYGGAGFASIRGGANDDVIHAGTGGGRFAGGPGKDTFVFGRGDGHVFIEDFSSRTDKLQFLGLSAGDIHTTRTTEGGVSGLLITYDAAGDSVFLAHVTELAAADMIFA
ncbi:MAG: family 16 glycosylhydrolase [Acetobacteraceae bacterium]|nr:family 16 glycosylhydrolase [Acetobacteraceae bacterium]